jgi:hypothetical protein
MGYQIPGAGLARAVMVEYDPVAGQAELTYGSTYAYDPSLDEPGLISGFSAGNYPATISSARSFHGWIRLYYGQTTIRSTDILPAQELISKGVAAVDVNAPLDNLLTDSNGDVLSDSDGNVIYLES